MVGALEIDVPGVELFDEENCKFIQLKPQHLTLMHSLLSVSKWEAKWKTSFFEKEEKSAEEALDYVRCMTLEQNVDPLIYYQLTEAQMIQIRDYIKDPMSAWTLSKQKSGGRKKILTSDRIYSWMAALNIPFKECEKWHLNRLFALIDAANEENTPPKMMSKEEIYAENRRINAANRAKFKSKG